MTPFYEAPRPRLFAHRGDSLHFPENTMPAFDAAVRAGIPYLETDVHCTHDGVVVVSHDSTTERVTGQRGLITKMTYEDLAALDAGYTFTPDGGESFPFRDTGVRYTTLEAVLTTFPAVYVNLEIKSAAPDDERRVAEVIRAAGAADRVCVAAFQDSIMQRFRALKTGIATSLAMQETFDAIQRIERGGFDDYAPAGRALQIPPRYGGREVVTDALLAAVRTLGLEVHVWTINDPADMRTLLERRVDGIMSDDPATLMRVAQQVTHGAD